VNRNSDSIDGIEDATRPPKLREARFDDYPLVTALQMENGLPTKTYEEWKHLWVNNPAYKEFHESLPIGWVLEDHDKQIVGYLGNIPLFYQFEDQRILASVAHAWTVDTRYRSYSLLLLDRYFSQQIVDLFLNATVGPAAADAFNVFHSTPAPVGSWDCSTFWITNYQGFCERWLTMKAFPLAAELSYALSVGLFFRDRLARKQLRQRYSGAELESCTELDGRFDVFWEALRKANPRALLAVRTREVLEWHFKYALCHNRAWIVTIGKGRLLSSYGIFFRHDNPTVGLKRMRLVDFQTLEGNTSLVVPMLAWAFERCRNEGIDMLESIGFRTDKRSVIKTIAPYQRKLPSWLYFYKTRDKSLSERLRDPTVWDPCQFDGDASL
jgi:hypothetical protein